MLFPVQSESSAIVRYGEYQLDIKKVFQSIEHDPALISEFAILCAEIYCRYANEDYSDDMPVKAGKHWKQENIKRPDLPKNIWHVDGLGMEVWTTPYHDKTVAVLIFRGTRGFSAWEDWFANCRWITKFIPFTWDQYDETHHIAQHVVNELKKLYPNNLDIYAAGHSLGGGLAQHAGYSVQEIKTIYAFNTSPITGFYSIPKAERDNSVRDMRILRVYEHGEILAYARLVMRFFYKISFRNPSIIEVRFNFDKWNDVVKQHNMVKFAKALKDISNTVFDESELKKIFHSA